MTLSPKLMRLSDGSLVYANGPLRVVRERYAFHYTSISNTLELRATLRAGPYVWPGGYALALLTDDGEALCFECARKEYRQVSASVRGKLRDGWRVVAVSAECDSDERCDCAHCASGIWKGSDDEDTETAFAAKLERARACVLKARAALGADLGGRSVTDLLADNFNWPLEECTNIAAQLGA